MTTTTPSLRRGRLPSPGSVAWWIACLLVSVLVLFPVIAVILASFKSAQENRAYPPTLLPEDWTLRNYIELGTTAFNVWQAVGNSAIVTIGSVVLTLVLSILAGYAFARLRIPGERWLFLVILATMMMPFQALLTPLLIILRSIGLNNTLLGLMLVYTTYALPFSIFVVRNAMRSIPVELTEAAVLDGAGRMRTLRTIILPLAIPGTASAALFTFFSSWNEFLGALILMSSQRNYTLPVILTILQSGRNGQIDWGILNAGVVISMIPCLLLYLLLQRYYVSGLLSGSIR